jgi:hypothetical protein
MAIIGANLVYKQAALNLNLAGLNLISVALDERIMTWDRTGPRLDINIGKLRLTTMRSRLSLNFTTTKDADLLLKVASIIAALENNPNYSRPWPDAAPKYEDLVAAHGAFQLAVQAALGRDVNKIAEREAARSRLIECLMDLAPYLELVAKGDENILMSTGYDVTQTRTYSAASRDPLGKPENFSVKRGELEGVLIAHATKLQGASSYELQIAEVDPTVEANWRQYAIFASASRMEIKGLTPGHKFSVRVRGIGVNGPGSWSETVTLMVV